MAAADPRPEELAPGVYCLQTGRGLTEANVYLVRSGPTWVLIDTAWPHRGHLIRAAAESLFGTGTRPAAILLTHIHPDHSGSALELARTWDLPVHVHPRELPLAPGGYLPQYGNPLDRWLIAPLLRLMPRRKVESSLSRTSLEGTAQAFDPGAGVPGLPDWQAIPTPGHTPGHVAFFRSSDRVLITGDAVLTVNLNSVRDLLAGTHRVVRPALHLHLELASGEGVGRRPRRAGARVVSPVNAAKRWSCGWPGAATKSCTTEAGHSSPRTPAARDLRLWWMPEDKPSWDMDQIRGGVRSAEAG